MVVQSLQIDPTSIKLGDLLQLTLPLWDFLSDLHLSCVLLKRPCLLDTEILNKGLAVFFYLFARINKKWLVKLVQGQVKQTKCSVQCRRFLVWTAPVLC